MDKRSAPAPREQSGRWWPLGIIAAVEVGLVAWIWNAPALHRQEQVMKTIALAAVGLLLVIVWLLLFSRLRWRLRLIGLCCALAPLFLTAILFRVHGVTGDLVPVLVPRWSFYSTKDSQHRRASDVRLPSELPEFPQFLGPTRDAVVAGSQLARNWAEQPPELLWRVVVGEGYAGCAIAANRTVTLEQQGENEAVVCRDVRTGATLWVHLDQARYETPLGGIGPRTTPAVAGERVYALGATGHLRCLDLSDGRLRWQRDIIRDAGSEVPDWGVAGSPLIVDAAVIVHPGGRGNSLASYSAESGERLWSAGNARAGYGSPQRVTLLGEPQFLIFNHEGVASHATGDGRVLWNYPWTRAAQHVSDPRVVGPNRFIVSSGYGAGVDLVELSRDPAGAWKTTRLWHSQRLKSKFASLVAHNGFLYGLDDGRLTCLEIASGEQRWTSERVAHGQILLNGDLLLVTSEKGEVLLCEAHPDVPKIVARFSALSGKMWNPPALAPPLLIVRTEREAACYRLPLAKE